MKTRLFGLVATVALFCAHSTAKAADITFSFGTLTNLQTSYSITVGAYTLNLFNPVNSGTTYVDNPGTKFTVDSDGIYFGNSNLTFPYAVGFDMSVTGGSLQFKSYVISYLNGSETGSFSLTGGTGTSTGNVLNPTGTYSFAGTKIISPGDTVTLDGTLLSGSLVELGSITFTTAVPEPSTYILAAIATGVMTAAARRRMAKGKG